MNLRYMEIFFKQWLTNPGVSLVSTSFLTLPLQFIKFQKPTQYLVQIHTVNHGLPTRVSYSNGGE